MDWLIPLAISEVVAVLGLINDIPLKTTQAVTLAVLGLMSFNALRQQSSRKSLDRDIAYVKKRVEVVVTADELLADKSQTGISRVLDSAVDKDWIPEIRAARHVVMVKIKGGGFTNTPEYQKALTRVLDAGGSVTIVVCDPRSPSMQLRYREEPTPLSTSTPVATSANLLWVNGLDELAADIHKMHVWLGNLIAAGHDTSRLRLLLFPGYPTHAFFRFDRKLFVYHYPYMSRGFHAPCMVFEDNSTAVYDYLCQCLQVVIDASSSLKDAADEIWELHQRGEFTDRQMERTRIVTRRVRT